MLIRTLFIAGLLFAAATAAMSAPFIKVGSVTREYKDETRKEWEGTGRRPLTTTIWYPAAPSRQVRYVFEGPVETQVFDSVPVATDAPSPARSRNTRSSCFPMAPAAARCR